MRNEELLNTCIIAYDKQDSKAIAMFYKDNGFDVKNSKPIKRKSYDGILQNGTYYVSKHEAQRKVIELPIRYRLINKSILIKEEDAGVFFINFCKKHGINTNNLSGCATYNYYGIKENGEFASSKQPFGKVIGFNDNIFKEKKKKNAIKKENIFKKKEKSYSKYENVEVVSDDINVRIFQD